MGNIKAPPAWLTPTTTVRVLELIDRRVVADALNRIGLTDAEIVMIERIAAVRHERPEITAGELVRAAIAAIGKGGFHADAI